MRQSKKEGETLRIVSLSTIKFLVCIGEDLLYNTMSVKVNAPHTTPLHHYIYHCWHRYIRARAKNW